MSTEMTGPDIRPIPLDRLVPHPFNSNVISPGYYEKLSPQVERRYPLIIVRPLLDGTFQILDGHVRTEILREKGHTHAWCCVWQVDDQEALVLLATLNRLEGSDLPAKRAALIVELAAHAPLVELARLLPEDEAQLEATLALTEIDLDAVIARLSEDAQRAAASLPALYSFAVDPDDAPIVDGAIERVTAELSGTNRKGRALVELARRYLEGT